MRGHIVSHPKSAEVGVPFLIEVEIENTRSTITQVRLEMRGLDDSAYAFNPLQVALFPEEIQRLYPGKGSNSSSHILEGFWELPAFLKEVRSNLHSLENIDR